MSISSQSQTKLHLPVTFNLYCTISVGLFQNICTGFIQRVYAGEVEERTQWKKAQK